MLKMGELEGLLRRINGHLPYKLSKNTFIETINGYFHIKSKISLNIEHLSIFYGTVGLNSANQLS